MVSRKIRDMAVIVALLGPWFLVIPMLFDFDPETGIHGIPAIVLYIFCCWIVLIVLARLLARRMDPQNLSMKGSGQEDSR